MPSPLRPGNGSTTVRSYLRRFAQASGANSIAIDGNMKSLPDRASQAGASQIILASQDRTAVGNFMGQTGIASGLGYAIADKWRVNASFTASPQVNDYGFTVGSSWTLN